MRIEFTANTATFDEMADTFIAGLAVDDGSETYFLLSRPLFGRGVHLEYNDQVNSGHDLISECRINRDRVEVDLSGTLAALEDVDGFDITLKIDNSTYKKLSEGLSKIFEGETGALLKCAQQDGGEVRS